MAYNFTAASSQYLSTVSAPASGTPMTIACWVRPTSVAAAQASVAVGVSSGTSRNQIGIASGGGPQINSTGTSSQTSTSGTGISANTWSHLCGTFSSTVLRELWQNATKTATGTANCGTQSTANAIVIGARWNTTLGLYASADLAECAVWNVVLADAEIASLADGMTCDKVRPQSLVFYAPLIRELQDLRGGLAITNNNTATVAVHPRVYS
jgi:hypothetical protein